METKYFPSGLIPGILYYPGPIFNLFLVVSGNLFDLGGSNNLTPDDLNFDKKYFPFWFIEGGTS